MTILSVTLDSDSNLKRQNEYLIKFNSAVTVKLAL